MYVFSNAIEAFTGTILMMYSQTPSNRCIHMHRRHLRCITDAILDKFFQNVVQSSMTSFVMSQHARSSRTTFKVTEKCLVVSINQTDRNRKSSRHHDIMADQLYIWLMGDFIEISSRFLYVQSFKHILFLCIHCLGHVIDVAWYNLS